MKKITLFLIFSIFCASAMFAQSTLKIRYGQRYLDTIYVNCSKDSLTGGAAIVQLYLENTSNNTQKVKFSQVSQFAKTSDGNYLSWCGDGFEGATCLADDGNVSFDLSKSSTIFFDIHYYPVENPDSAFAWYTLKNEANTDSVSVFLCFGPKVQTTPMSGIANPITKEVALNAYPNPAKTMVNFTYTLPQSQADAKIVLRDMVGKVVKEVALKQGKDKAALSVEDLANGVYFYTLLVNDVASITKKLVVKH